MTGAGVSTVVSVAAYDKALRLSRTSLEGPRLGQALNFQVGCALVCVRVCVRVRVRVLLCI